jgi:hypothetical protein
MEGKDVLPYGFVKMKPDSGAIYAIAIFILMIP